MHLKQLKKNSRVVDSWYPHWGVGRVLAVLKTRAKVLFPNRGLLTYDKAHTQFLKLAPRAS